MIWAIIGCYALAAVIGVTLAAARQKKQPLPTPVALAHGALAGTGTVLLLVLVLRGVMPGLGVVALAIFAAAAVGGVMIFSTRFRQGAQAPMSMVVGHAVAAVTAFVLLLLVVL